MLSPFSQHMLEQTPEQLQARLDYLMENITYQVFNFSRRGLFDRHKLILATQLTFKVLGRAGKLKEAFYHAASLSAEAELQSLAKRERLELQLHGDICGDFEMCEAVTDLLCLGAYGLTYIEITC